MDLMEDDLSRSVRLLEDALSTPSRGLYKKPINKKEPDFNVSITLAAHELQQFQSSQFMNDLLMDDTIAGGVIQNENPWKAAVDSLYFEFFGIIQGQTSQDTLETISELARCCSDALKIVKGLTSKVAVNAVDEEKWLEKEKDTWRLLFILYQDRLLSQHNMEDDQFQYFGKSEKKCVEELFKRDNLIRECQLVIDWLEAGACEKDDQTLHFSDATVGWENTLHQLQTPDSIAFQSSRPTVDKLDPDAPHYQKRSLHDLDTEDEKRLSKKIFTEIRCGKLEEAQKLARQSGHSWKAAILEGWRLFHNPNLKEDDFDGDRGSEVDDGYEEMDSNELKDLEGNSNRDIWKIMALRYSKQEWISSYDRASVGTFCGNLNAILPVCNNWQDSLWAYMKSVIDIRVESEIRDCCSKDNQYLPLPEEYWLQRMSLNDVFTNLESSKNKFVRDESKEPERIIQKYIILDDVPALLKELEEWSESPTVSTQFLRFSSHLVLFLDQIGQVNKRDAVERVLEMYIKRLMEMNETQLVAFYVSKLCTSNQVYLYAKHLETITDQNERKTALQYAEDCGLDVLAITKQIVENIRNKPEELDLTGNLQHKLTETDKRKISAIDWLVYYESQRLDLLKQTNQIVFNFLVMEKVDAAELAFGKIPSEAVAQVLAESEDSNEEIKAVVKEHLSYKAYLEATEAFNEWFQQIKCKPAEPDELPESAQFPEKVAYQHKVSQYKAEIERWKLTTTHLAKTAQSLLYNVLLFPEGWLIGAKEPDHLRQTILPKVTFLLCSVLYETEMYEKCIELADIIAAERYRLYEEFSQEQIQDFLLKITEASMALIERGKDPFGYEKSA